MGVLLKPSKGIENRNREKHSRAKQNKTKQSYVHEKNLKYQLAWSEIELSKYLPLPPACPCLPSFTE